MFRYISSRDSSKDNWSHRSQHDDTRLDHYFSGSLELNRMLLDDPQWEPGQAPHELGRAQLGRISIANSDSEGRAYLDAAIDSAWRAVAEQTV